MDKKFRNGEREFIKGELVYFLTHKDSCVALGVIEEYIGDNNFTIHGLGLKDEFREKYRGVQISDKDKISKMIDDNVLEYKNVENKFDCGMARTTTYSDYHRNSIFKTHDEAIVEIQCRKLSELNLKSLSLIEELYYELNTVLKNVDVESKEQVLKLIQPHITGTNAYNLAFRIYNDKFQYGYKAHEWKDLCPVVIPIKIKLEKMLAHNKSKGKYCANIEPVMFQDIDDRKSERIKIYSDTWEELVEIIKLYHPNRFEYIATIVNQRLDIYEAYNSDFNEFHKIELNVNNEPEFHYYGKQGSIVVVNNQLKTAYLTFDKNHVVTVTNGVSFKNLSKSEHNNNKMSNRDISEYEEKIIKKMRKQLPEHVYKMFEVLL